MKSQEHIQRQVVMTRLLNTFSAMDGGLAYMTLREFAENAEGEAISRTFSFMGLLLDVAGIPSVGLDELPARMWEHAITLED